MLRSLVLRLLAPRPLARRLRPLLLLVPLLLRMLVFLLVLPLLLLPKPSFKCLLGD